MRIFDYEKIKHTKWDLEVLDLVSRIYRYQARQEIQLQQKSQDINKLIPIAKIQSIKASNEIEGIVTTSNRLKQLIAEKTLPKNKAEQEIVGYRDVFNIINEDFAVIPLTKNYILQLHKILLSYLNNPIAGKTKNVQNYISATYQDGHREVLFTPVSPFETPHALDMICRNIIRLSVI